MTDPAGAVISYTYYSDGDLATITTPLGETITYTYDNLGRVLSQKAVSNTYPAGQTTSYAYDGLGEVVKETSPSVTDRVTGAVHQAVTTTSYDADGDVLSQTVADATGGDASRTKSFTYNAYDQVATATDGDNGVTKYSYDGYGNKTSETDPGGITTNYAYDPDGNSCPPRWSAIPGPRRVRRPRPTWSPTRARTTRRDGWPMRPTRWASPRRSPTPTTGCR